MPVTLEQIESCGVVGAGGAGFPTHIKLKSRADTIILNGAECEPLLHKDKELMKHHGRAILEGFEECRRLVGAESAVVGIKGKYTEVIDAMRPMLGAKMRIQELSDSYPAGDEFILVYDVTKRIIPPGKIPLAVGCVVVNVETALNVAWGRPVTEKFLTVAGAVKHPRTLRVPVGITFAEAIALCGGASIADPVVLVGGAMMGKYSDNLQQPITKTTGGMIVLSREHPLIQRYTKTWKSIQRIGASACDQCTLCTMMCPRYLLGHPIEPHKAMRSLVFNMAGEYNTVGTQFCCECNICSMIACPEDLDPKNVCTENKHRILKSGSRWEVEADTVRPELHLDNRRAPISRLILKLGLSQFINEGPLVEEAYRPKRVVLPLKQHAGAPARPTVKVGDSVRAGDLIARPNGGDLGAHIHASIAGRIVKITDSIEIES